MGFHGTYNIPHDRHTPHLGDARGGGYVLRVCVLVDPARHLAASVTSSSRGQDRGADAISCSGGQLDSLLGTTTSKHNEATGLDSFQDLGLGISAKWPSSRSFSVRSTGAGH
jgi:hypothetical protein